MLASPRSAEPIVETQPILVVGAGPSGLAAALALRSMGIGVTLLEANSREVERTGSRALFLHKESLARLAKWDADAASQIVAYGITWGVRRTVYRGKIVSEQHFDPVSSHALPPFVSLRQKDTERFLRDACLKAGVQIIWDSPVIGVGTTAEVAVVETAHRRYWAKQVIAADGGRSAVRRSLKIGMRGGEGVGFHVVVDILDRQPASAALTRTFHYEHPHLDGRNLLTIPFRGGWQLDLQCRAGDSVESYVDASALTSWVAKVASAEWTDHIDSVATYRFHQLIATSFVDEHRRVLLIGDSAHMFPPFGARGMNSGIADAEAAANAVRLALESPCEAERRNRIDEFAQTRYDAAVRNGDAAAKALRHMQCLDLMSRAKRRIAASLARQIPRFGNWLESGPYGRPTKSASGIY